MDTALPLIAIYLYTKFYINANSSFEVICRTRNRMDGQMDKAATICFPFGEHKNALRLNQWKGAPVLRQTNTHGLL